jgi:hypothetical protein
MEVLQTLLLAAFLVFLGLGARVVWRNYLSRDFKKSFPELACQYCACPRGWKRPVRRALRELSRVRKEHGDVQVLEIKEKFGGLRFYTFTLNNEELISPIISRVEKACSCRCQECGRPGEYRALHGRRATLCDRCKQQWQDKS